MNFGEFQEKKSRGTFDFPIELHHVTKEHRVIKCRFIGTWITSLSEF